MAGYPIIEADNLEGARRPTPAADGLRSMIGLSARSWPGRLRKTPIGRLGDRRTGTSARFFTYENGEPLTPQYVTRQFDRLHEQAGLPEMTFHGLRHQ